MATDKLTVAQALAQAQLIDASLAAWEQTAPCLVASMGGRDALARRCEMTCVGPMPRLDAPTWEQASAEYTERRLYAAGNPYAAPPGMHEPGPPAHADLPDLPAAPRRAGVYSWG